MEFLLLLVRGLCLSFIVSDNCMCIPYLLSLLLAVPPVIWIQNQMVGAYEGQHVVLECYSEAYPKSINYWTTENGEIVPQSIKSLSAML